MQCNDMSEATVMKLSLTRNRQVLVMLCLILCSCGYSHGKVVRDWGEAIRPALNNASMSDIVRWLGPPVSKTQQGQSEFWVYDFRQSSVVATPVFGSVVASEVIRGVMIQLEFRSDTLRWYGVR